ncbi:MAG: bifunctional alpha,alpha-trehalose-phosphate synthase (UDP-forming)/trehalose-phosphatase [Sedimentisphaerales bacterium]|nr:bifunctional alpha,alpha-trehalose-phosphate synthase (UDP-forming)/trehalose-phosphatase [Sedimentisphaerales bacterium]
MRLLIVSNRLPISIAEEDGQLAFKESTGGLVSGLSAYLDSLKGSSLTKSGYIWVGWPGIAVDDAKQEQIRAKAFSDYNAYPVFLSERSMEKFYHGFCNKTIWPLFHYFTSYVVYDQSYYSHYKCVNQIFCEAVLKIARPGDVIWIHDYHLMLLPRLLKEQRPDIPVAFFLHIPFPTFELFRTLPIEWRSEILQGILGADLIGFHTHDYTEYFLRCVLRILGYDHNMGNIYLPKGMVKVDTFPMGIDFRRFSVAANSPETKEEKDRCWHELMNFKIVLSIDRLDYTKGIVKRLEGYELFLEQNPQWQKKVVLLVVVVPSRVGVEHYQQMKSQIDELVGKINGRFGAIGWTPIIYQSRFIPFEPLVALYAASDVALLTPLRDGMNLISKEYVASRVNGTGVLILSEMTGASKELSEALVINPNDVVEIASAIRTALEMPIEEQTSRMRIMQERLRRYDVIRWADDFMGELADVLEDQKKQQARFLRQSDRERLIRNFNLARNRILFLDYDGTLVPFTNDPSAARPGADLMEIIRKFSSDPKTDLVLISGRDKNTLQNWFGAFNIGFVAEHGVWNRDKQGDWQLIKPLDNSWKPKILPILQIYADRLPGAFIEEKEYSLVWHYRRSDPELASVRARELTDDLMAFTANIDVQILQGSKVVEIRCGGATKGTAVLRFLSGREYDFILAVGDDWTDEDMFKALPDSACSIRVGMLASSAKYNLQSHAQVIELLEQFLHLDRFASPQGFPK